MTRAEIRKLTNHLQRELMVLVDHAPVARDARDSLCHSLTNFMNNLRHAYAGRHLLLSERVVLDHELSLAAIWEEPINASQAIRTDEREDIDSRRSSRRAGGTGGPALRGGERKRTDEDAA